MTNTAAMVGAAGGAPVAVFVKMIGWRAAVSWIGGAELALAVLAFLMIRDRMPAANQPISERESPTRIFPTSHKTPTDRSAGLQPALGERTRKAGAKPALRANECEISGLNGGAAGLLMNRYVWINAIYATSISLVLVAFGGLWGTSYIQKAYGVDAIAAAGTGSLLFLGGIAGSLFFGWYSDFLGRRKPPMVQAGIAALVTMTCALYFPGLPLAGFKAGLFLVGFFSSANIVSYAVARDLYPKLAGLSIGFLSTCFYAGSAASQPLVGMLLERRNSGGPHAGLASLTAADFRFAFCPLVIFMLVGLVASLLMKETLEIKPTAMTLTQLSGVETKP